VGLRIRRACLYHSSMLGRSFCISSFAILSLGACSLVNAPADPEGPNDDGDGHPTTASSGGATSASTSSTGGTGGTPLCTDATDCESLGDACNEPVCTAGVCDTAPAPAGTPCGDPTATLCDAADACDGAGLCQTNTLPDGTACDADVCVDGDVCMAGICGGGAPKDCSILTSGCVVGVCNPQNGSCISQPQTMCVDGDGCCPAGCSGANDSDCNCVTNLSGTATALSSGGGSGGFGPQIMKDGVGEAGCNYHWISNDTATLGKFIQYDWPNTVQIGSMYLDVNPCSGSCSAGRSFVSGKVQYWNGNAWITAVTFQNNLGDYAVSFSPAITTTKLRVFDILAGTCEQASNTIIYEWYVWSGFGCLP
jgi:hypothetical protein